MKWRRNSLVNEIVSSCVEVWKAPRNWQTDVIILILKKKITSIVQTTKGYHSLVCQQKYMPDAWKQNVEKKCNQSWRMARAVFVQVAVYRPDLHFEANLREIFGVWQISQYALLILKKHMTRRRTRYLNRQGKYCPIRLT